MVMGFRVSVGEILKMTTRQSGHSKPPKDSDRYETPQWFFDWVNSIFQFDLDVCAEKKTAKCSTFFTIKDDAFSKGWYQYGKRVWCNPPYSKVMPWVISADEERMLGVLTVMLVRADHTAEWFKKALALGAARWNIPFRIPFLMDGVEQLGYNFPSCLLIFVPYIHKPKRNVLK